ncbi:hypothetical protein JK358_33070 [Nocardia sp. 2]|uniref:Uncharacterized protein n=1 Tax=Nocardia acididurans TaxID=2802282 RepID=A0ABS1MG63_9NOCA|nr:hypothetical protein [Nocardia acididurans]MBL1079249.1 hypothetical protein [Nocardia acididurans]
MSDILDILHARCAEIAADAILTGEKHPSLTLSAPEVESLLDHLTDLNRRLRDAALAFERIHTVLHQRTAHPDAQARQAATIARHAAHTLH